MEPNYQAGVTAFTRTAIGEKITDQILLNVINEISSLPLELSQSVKDSVYAKISKAYTPVAIKTFNTRALVTIYVIRALKEKITPKTIDKISSRTGVSKERLVWYNRMIE